MPAATLSAPVRPAGAASSIACGLASRVLVLATLGLVFLGAQVKSHEAGLAVPDWPLSYGQLWPPMVAGTFHEHLHRTVGAGVGLLALGLALWISRSEPRPALRRLAWVGVGAVALQGLLGGLTVKGLLPPAVSASHGTLAQAVLCLLATLAYALSPEGRAVAGSLSAMETPARRAARAACGLGLAAVAAQLVLGAWMRHTEAGLAVPFFPVSSQGDWWPQPVDSRVVVHLAHRGFALVVAALLWRAVLVAGRASSRLFGHGALLAALVGLQLFLGAAVVWTGKTPLVASLHVVVGASVLLLIWLLLLRVGRLGVSVRGSA